MTVAALINSIDDRASYKALRTLNRVSGYEEVTRGCERQPTDDLRTIGQSLGAAYLVEGSVRRAGDHIRVTAQLIDSRNGTHRWPETYDRSVGYAVEVQDEIAASLVRALQLELVPAGLVESRSSVSRGEPYDLYLRGQDLYLRGQHALSRGDQQGIEEAIAYFRHSLELSPTFAPASDYVAADVGWEETRKAAEHALRLNPRSARARPGRRATFAGAITSQAYPWARSCRARLYPQGPAS